MKWKDIQKIYDARIRDLVKERAAKRKQYFTAAYAEAITMNPEAKSLEIYGIIADQEGYSIEHIRYIIAHKREKRREQ